MTRRLYLIAFVAIAVIAGLSVYVATRVEPKDLGGAGDLSVKAQSVPALAAAKGWVNSPPLSPEDLRGKVVVYDFWTYSCVNCVRTLPHVKALYDRYASDGLVIVGIHSPEFDFEKDHDNVQRAVQQLGVTWPVALDDDMAIWNAFSNNYWPEEYLTDRDGKLRQVYIGEGAYDQKENDVRTLLGEAQNAPRAADDGQGEVQPTAQTPEIHFGLSFGAQQFSSSSQPLSSGTTSFAAPASVPVDTFALEGQWNVSGQGIESQSADAAIELRYRATEVNIVAGAGTAEAPVMLAVELDGVAQPPVSITGDDLYRVLSNGPEGVHDLVLRPMTASFNAFAFTFGSGDN
ncbi:MAG TPA: redoxin family protein [Acidimicrobiales bacterium]|nr:redoxin family protein [Acidimicrobiales bacterium]